MRVRGVSLSWWEEAGWDEVGVGVLVEEEEEEER